MAASTTIMVHVMTLHGCDLMCFSFLIMTHLLPPPPPGSRPCWTSRVNCCSVRYSRCTHRSRRQMYWSCGNRRHRKRCGSQHGLRLPPRDSHSYCRLPHHGYQHLSHQRSDRWPLPAAGLPKHSGRRRRPVAGLFVATGSDAPATAGWPLNLRELCHHTGWLSPYLNREHLRGAADYVASVLPPDRLAACRLTFCRLELFT